MIGTLFQRSSLSAAFDNRLSFGEKPYAVEKGPYIALPLGWCVNCVCRNCLFLVRVVERHIAASCRLSMPLAQSHPWQPVPVKHEDSDLTEVRKNEAVCVMC